MKKFNFRQLRFRQVDIGDLNDRVLLINLYATQVLTFFIGLIILFFQKRNLAFVSVFPEWKMLLLYGLGFACAVIVIDLIVSRWVPEVVTDDGGINELIFAKRPLWHIALMSLVVSVCEEFLFRGVIQLAWGPYWTSILFAAIHFRYLRHWIMTGLVFSISYGLGWIYIQTGSLWTPIAAHFLIDFVMGCMIKYRRDAS